MNLTRRGFFAGAAAFAAAPALAQGGWPNRPITLVVGFPPGGPADSVSRILADALSEVLGQNVLVDNRAGATGTTAAAQVARSAPDGYTLLVAPATFAATAATFKRPGYQPLDDFVMISMTCESLFVIVTHADHRIRSISDLIEIARSQETPLQYGTGGAGSIQHLAMELFASRAKVKLQHIPYRGGAPAITDLLGKRIDLVLDPPTAMIQHIRAGKLRAIAVTSPARFFDLPETPTLQEAGIADYSVTSWQGLAAPAALPAPIVNRLNEAVATILAYPNVADRLKALGMTPRRSTPDEFKARVASDIRTWVEVVQAANIELI